MRARRPANGLAVLADPTVVGQWRFLNERAALDPRKQRAPSAAPPAEERGQRGGQFELIADGGGKRETHRETHRETRNAPSSALRAADEAARAAGYEVAAALSSESVLPEDRPWEAPAPAAARGADKGRVDRDDSDDELLEMAESRAKRGGAVRFSDYIFQPGGGGKGAMAAKAAHSDGGGGIGSGGGADIGGYDKMTDMEREALKAMEDAGVDEPAPMATAQSPAGSDIPRKASATPPVAEAQEQSSEWEREAAASARPRRKGQRYTANSPRLPQIVDSSFNYAPKPRQRPPKYGAWYVPVDSWQIGGLAPPPEELTPQEKEQIERNFKRRQTLADEHPRNKMSKAYKHFLMREGLQVPHYLQSVQ